MSALLQESSNNDCTVVLQDGSKIDIDCLDLWRNNLHNFKGWICNAGMDTIIIESDFTVWSGVCRNDNMGNLFDDDFALAKGPTVCVKDHCTTCKSDLNNFKKKVN